MPVSLKIWETVEQGYLGGSSIYYLIKVCGQVLSTYVDSGAWLCSLRQKPNPRLGPERYGCELDRMPQTLGVSITVRPRVFRM